MPIFDETRFPDKIAALQAGPIGGPAFMTEIVRSKNGFEQRNVSWSREAGVWDIGTGMKRRADLQEVVAFYYAGVGAAYGFRYKDYSDFNSTGQLIRTAAGGETTTPLIKTYTRGSRIFVRLIQKPLSTGFNLYKNAAPFAGSLNTVTGVVTHAALAPGDILTADFEFDVPVRFDEDDLRVQLQTFDRGGVPRIILRQIKLNAAGQG